MPVSTEWKGVELATPDGRYSRSKSGSVTHERAVALARFDARIATH